MLHCEDIEESFYDLFNQNFSTFDQGKENIRYYANIALGAQMKWCFVDPNFQCIVVIKQKLVDATPGPYLNRFEKFCITHKSILNDHIHSLPKRLAVLLYEVLEKVHFILYYLFTELTIVCFNYAG